MDAYLAIHMAQMWRFFELEQAGMLDEGATLRIMQSDFQFLFGSRFAKVWWEQMGQDWPTEFVATARPVVASVDVDGLDERFGRMQRLLGTEPSGE